MTQSIPPDAVPVALQRVLTAQYSGLAEPRRMVIRDAAAWGAFWAEATGPHAAPAAPDVDFTRGMVLVAAMGTRPTGGYGISIESAYRGRGGLLVAVKHVSPAPGRMATQALTAPLDVVRVAQTDDQVTFVDM